MKKYIIIFSIALSISFSYSQIKEKVILNDSVISLLNKTVTENQIPGVTFSVIDNTGEIKNYVAGYSDVEESIELTTKHTFLSGSIGKTYAATLVFKLAESGDINLNKHYKDYFPEIDWLNSLPNIENIRIEMLLQHSSGLPRYVLKPEIWNTLHEYPNKVWTYEERLKVIFNDNPVHEAGKGWAYSDTNYILLGMLIEKVTGKAYYELVENIILGPYQLTNTHPSNTRIISNLSQGYSRLPEGFHVPEKTVKDKEYFMNPQVEWTGGGMASTTEDLAKWAKLYYEGKLVNENSLEQITTPNENGNNVESTSSYGMGSFIYASKHGKAFGHTGFMPGFNSIFIYYPELSMAAAINFNCDYASSILNMNDLIDSLISIAKN